MAANLTQSAAAALLLFFCAAEPYAQPQGAQDVFRSATETTEACVQSIFQSTEFAPLRGHFPYRADRPTLEQMTDGSLATDDQIAALYAIHPRYQACRAEALNAIGPVAPMIGAIFAEAFTEGDAILVELILRNISWGEYARRNQAALARYNPRIIAEVQAMEQAQQRSQEEAARRRQAAVSAFAAWVQQQQVINGMNRARVVNCTAHGISVICQSQ